MDLSDPGAWSDTELAGARITEQRQPSDQPARTGMAGLVEDADEAEGQLETILRRRAVND
jgi:hypothetical protein